MITKVFKFNKGNIFKKFSSYIYVSVINSFKRSEKELFHPKIELILEENFKNYKVSETLKNNITYLDGYIQ